jgi:hypothetical protein
MLDSMFTLTIIGNYRFPEAITINGILVSCAVLNLQSSEIYMLLDQNVHPCRNHINTGRNNSRESKKNLSKILFNIMLKSM